MTLVLILIVYAFLVSTRSRSSNFCLLFLFASRISDPIINGFPFAHESKLLIGQLNTVLGYIFLMFSLFELLLNSVHTSWHVGEYLSISGLVIIGIAFFFWQIYHGVQLGFSDFTFLTLVFIFAYLRADERSLKYLPYLAFISLTVIFLCAITKYQNPYFPYYQIDFGIDGPYHNFVWDLFGITERFRGPYISPNILAFNVVFLGIMCGIRKSRLSPPSIVMAMVILLLSGSRISLLTFSLYLVLRTIFRDSYSVTTENSEMKSYKSSTKKTGLVLGTFGLIGLFGVSSILITASPTLNGRTTNYAAVIQNLKANFLFGSGPSFNGNVTTVENTYLTIVNFYGLFGILAIALIMTGMLFQYKSLGKSHQQRFLIVFIPFMAASCGEYMLGGGVNDIGLLYILLIMVLGGESTIKPLRNSDSKLS